MTVVVGYLWVAPPKEATVLPDGTVTWPGARRIVGEGERVAIEFARGLAEALGERLVGITIGDELTATGQAANAGLACGLDEAVVVRSGQPLGSADAAAAAAAVISELDDVRLVVLGTSAADSGTRMFGPCLGGFLRWPVLTDVLDATIDGDILQVQAEAHRTRVRHQLRRPAVLCVSPASRTPRQMGLRDIMAASSKPSRLVEMDQLGAAPVGAVRVVGTAELAPSGRGGRVVAGVDPEAAAAEVLAELVTRGVLS